MTKATKITIARIAILPLILFFYVSGSIIDDTFFILNGKLIALILFVVAAATDWVDGWVARKFNQVSDMGKLLDPIADKMLTTLGFILVITDFTIVYEVLPLWFAITAVFIALGRDIIVNALRTLAVQKKIEIAADNAGKIKSVMQFVAIALLMFYAYDYVNMVLGVGDLFKAFEFLCLFSLSLATLLSIYSGVNYLIKYKGVFESKKEKKTWEEKANG